MPTLAYKETCKCVFVGHFTAFRCWRICMVSFRPFQVIRTAFPLSLMIANLDGYNTWLVSKSSNQGLWCEIPFNGHWRKNTRSPHIYGKTTFNQKAKLFPLGSSRQRKAVESSDKLIVRQSIDRLTKDFEVNCLVYTIKKIWSNKDCPMVQCC